MKVSRLAVLVLGVVLVLGIGIGLAMRDVVPVVKERLAPNHEKALAVAFYKAYELNQDPAAAWDMMDPLYQKSMGGRKDFFLAAQQKITQVPTPDTMAVQEWRRPQQQAFTYLIKGKDVDPVVVVVCECDGRLAVLKSYRWKGEALP